MQIFLSYYEQIKASITNFFLATRCRILSCDHGFKVSEHIGIIQDSDSAFVNQFQNLYVATSTELKQINHIIPDLKERIRSLITIYTGQISISIIILPKIRRKVVNTFPIYIQSTSIKSSLMLLLSIKTQFLL